MMKMILPKEKVPGWKAMYRKHRELPSRMSMALELAIDDLVHRTTKPNKFRVDFVPNMNVWHEYDSERGVCCICLAGAMISRTLQESYPHRESSPECVAGKRGNQLYNNRLRAIDCLRYGGIGEAWKRWHGQRHVPTKISRLSIHIPHYRKDWDEFIKVLRKLSKDLYDIGE